MPYDRTRFAAARLRAADSQPFLAQALYALTPLDAPELGTFAVDRRLRLRIDGTALDRWTVPEAAGVLLHEVSHVLRDHAGRAQAIGVGPDAAHRWNRAADAEINDDLLADGVELPGIPITPLSLGLPPGRAAEYYHHALGGDDADPSRQPVPVPVVDCGSGCHGCGDDDGPDAGDVSVGPTAQGQEAAAGPPPPGLSDAELLILRRRVAEAVLAAAARAPGAVTGGWTRWAEALLDPRLDWRAVLQGHLRRAVAETAGRVDYAYHRPSRRQMPGVVLPAMRRPIPAVGVVVDVSGSITPDDLSRAWTEVHGCLRAIGVRRDLLRVYATDVDTVRVADMTARRVALPGGGGTDLRHGIATALRGRPRPGVVVTLTDGWTPWPDRPIGVPLVVALLPQPPGLATPPPPPSWARVVTLEA